MRALVTGGGGFLGKAIVKLLLEAGARSLFFFTQCLSAIDRAGCRTICWRSERSSCCYHGCWMVVMLSTTLQQKQVSVAPTTIFTSPMLSGRKILSRRVGAVKLPV